MPDALPSLLSRIEAATGADREIDAALCKLFLDNKRFTSSVDAVIALIERELPGWKWSLTNVGYDNGIWQNGRAGARLTCPESSGLPTATAFAATPALALLAALIRAKIAQTENAE